MTSWTQRAIWAVDAQLDIALGFRDCLRMKAQRAEWSAEVERLRDVQIKLALRADREGLV